MKLNRIALAALLFLTFSTLKAQFVEDALRYALPNGVLTPRVAGLNIAYHGVSDDLGALYYNPAGLSLLSKSEISIGLGFTRNSTITEFLHISNPFNSNDEYLTHLGIAVPVKLGKKNAAIGIGYFLESNFDNNMEFNAFNPTSTFIADLADNSTANPDNNVTKILLLSEKVNGKLHTPIRDSLTQSSFIQEKGGLHNVTGGAAFDLNDYVAVGFSIIGKWGTYIYKRNYQETDNLNIYNFYDPTDQNFTNTDFKSFTYNENVNQDISGITGSIAIQARIENFMRFGAAIKFPTFYSIDEKFTQSYLAEFDNGDNYPLSNDGRSSYNIKTPFVYSAGMSINALGLTFAAGVEYTDATQLEFTDGPSELENLNVQIVKELVGQVNWGFGVEYEVPMMPVVVRSSYARTTSPYQRDIAGANQSIFSFGGGIYLGKSVRLDAVFRWSDVSELRTNYGTQMYGSNYIFSRSPLSLSMSVTYRY